MKEKALAAAEQLVREIEKHVADQAGFIKALERQRARTASEAKAWLAIFRAILELAHARERGSNERNLRATR